MPDKTILIMAGGTGGHVYPALAVADNLKEKGFKLFWLGTSKGLEANVVPEHGYPLLKINVSGIRGKGIVKLLLAPIMLVLALLQALKVMIQVRPVAVLGMGGFASGPGGIAAWLMRIPLLIHERNAIAGLTNRLLAPFAVSVMQAFPNAFKASNKLVITGNPVRTDILNLSAPEQRFKERDVKTLNVLVLGGSLGAKHLNEVVPETIKALTRDFKLRLKHQCGKQHLAATKQHYKELELNADVYGFFEDMADVYSWADLVICRAGALTIAELAACGVGSILIPFPYAVDDHQTENAKYLSSDGGAILIQEAQLNVDKLKEVLTRLFQAHEQLRQMAMKAHTLAKPDATEAVANLCVEASNV